MFEGWGAAAAAAAVVGGVVASNSASSAAKTAANAQTSSANAGIAAQQGQFDQIQKLLAPYVAGGTNAFQQQQDLIGAGTGGAGAQQTAINGIMSSPAYTSALQQGNNNILANASATGGLRGGNVQGALGQFAPSLLAATINDRFNQLGTISQQGLGAATQTGSFGQNSTNNVTGLLGQIGGYQAGNALAQGNANVGYAGAIGNGLGAYSALYKPGTTTTPTTTPGFSYDYGNSYNPNVSNGGFGYKDSGSGF